MKDERHGGVGSMGNERLIKTSASGHQEGKLDLATYLACLYPVLG